MGKLVHRVGIRCDDHSYDDIRCPRYSAQVMEKRGTLSVNYLVCFFTISMSAYIISSFKLPVTFASVLPRRLIIRLCP
jgi:hypothetical protein